MAEALASVGFDYVCADMPHGVADYSDVVPMIEAGGHGILVPSDAAWALEHADAPSGHPRYHEIADIAALPPLLDRIG